jgi:UDP-N-acetylmuramoyl-tripeptide--D-alanyl-D-alanine ligase
VRKSHKSFNSEIGLPLTILDLPNAWNNHLKWLENIFRGLFYACFLKDYPEYLVLEIGSDRPGDIDKVSKWLPVHIAVLTRMPQTPVHVEFFKDGHAVNEEDKKILKALQKNAIIITNADDSEMNDVVGRYPAFTHMTFGVEHDVTVRARDISSTLTGIQFSVISNGETLPLATSGVAGTHHVYPFLAALAVIRALSLDMLIAVQALMMHTTPKGRMKIIPGKNDTTIIDDTYNSSPVAVEEALKALKALEIPIETTGKKIAVLGDMLELGPYTEREHQNIGKMIPGIADTFLTVGHRSEDSAKSAIAEGMDANCVHTFQDGESALEYLEKHIQSGDIILIKGSQGMRMERIVKGLMANPDKASEILVRQEKEWEGR